MEITNRTLPRAVATLEDIKGGTVFYFTDTVGSATLSGPYIKIELNPGELGRLDGNIATVSLKTGIKCNFDKKSPVQKVVHMALTTEAL